MKKSEKFVVTAQASYLKSQSDPAAERFFWTYEVTIENQSEDIVQLLNRYWRITDLSGKVEEVAGPGVIGLQPLIKPGKKFSYSSFCQLRTPQGTMEGFYELQNLEEEHFTIEIPKFVLSAPSSVTKTFRDRLH